MIFRKVIPGSVSPLKIVDHNETYGRHVIEKVIKPLEIESCLDLGCGFGQDLSIVRNFHPNAKLYGIDYGLWNAKELKSKGVEPLSINIEQDVLPFKDESIDLIIANQVLEHTKEVFWINHEIFRCLKKDGLFILGVPNTLSLHNRVLMACGYHPTCNVMLSAHVRVFSKKDVELFYSTIGHSFCTVDKCYGSQFYPFPKPLARLLSNIFPTLAVSNFYLIRKSDKYTKEFLAWPRYAHLETNYYVG